MHIEKNVHDSILSTLLNIYRKMKDGLNARLDLQESKFCLELHLVVGERSTFVPLACFTLTKQEKKNFLTHYPKLNFLLNIPLIYGH